VPSLIEDRTRTTCGIVSLVTGLKHLSTFIRERRYSPAKI